jgi:hypothetical protein
LTQSASNPSVGKVGSPIHRHTVLASHSTKIREELVLWISALFAVTTTVCPVVRSFYHFEINYVEGWNVYNALKVAQHVPLYGAKYAWTTVNYPALSFYVIAYISHITIC